MEGQISFIDGIVQVIVNLAPLFALLVVIFLIFSWLRILFDYMSGRGL